MGRESSQSPPPAGALREFLDGLRGDALIDRFKLALEGANLGIWDWDLRNNDVQFDRRWCEMLGLVHGDTAMILDTWSSRVHPDDIEQCYVDINRHIEGETAFYENVHRMRHAEGHWVYILDRGRISGWDEQGNPIRFTGTHFDVTQTEEAKRIIEGEQSLLEMMVRNLPSAVAMFDREMRYLAASGRWIEDYQLSGIAVEGRCHYELLPGSKERWHQIHQRALAGECVQASEDALIHKDGSTRWLRWDVRPWHTRSGDIGGVLMSTDDITENIARRVDEEHRARLTALGLMTAGIAHEINSPLQAIVIDADILASESSMKDPDLETIRESAQAIQETVQQVSGIIDSMKGLARSNERDEASDILVDGLFRDLDRLTKNRCRADNIELSLTNNDPNACIVGNRSAYGQVLLNLVNNAIAALAASEGTRRILVTSESEDTEIIIRCADNGCGIPQEIKNQVMQPYFTTNSNQNNSGMGLSISRSIAERSGGSLVILDDPDWTIFELRLPRTQPTMSFRPSSAA